MKIKYDQSILKPEKNGVLLSKIELIAWSPNLKKIAIYLSNNNQIILFDGFNYEKKDKFALKSAKKDQSNNFFMAKGLCFSPDSTKLAVGQTDCVIFVYKIGETWNEKKSIVGKYMLQSPITDLYWHTKGIIYGSMSGKIKLISTQSNRILSLIFNNSMVTALKVCEEQLVAGFLNGAIFWTLIDSNESNGHQIITTTSPPFALGISHLGYICICSSDGRITFVQIGSTNPITLINKQIIEINSDLSCVSFSPSSNVSIVASLDKLNVFTLDSNFWKLSQIIQLEGSDMITSLHFTKDSTKFIVGSVNGALELFTFQFKKKIIMERFEISHLGLNQVLIKDISTNHSAIFRSNSEVKEIKILRETFVIIWTKNSLLLANINFPEKISEIDWTGMTSTGIKFYFDFENIVLISNTGELYIIELGCDQILASLRTDFVSPWLISVRINERNSGKKIVAYLIDLKTIAILDLVSKVQLCVWSSDERINWLEINETGKKLLFRDRLFKLFLLDIPSQENVLLLNFCEFVQWVPNSDVVVAQSKNKLYVWYDLVKPVVYELTQNSKAEAIGIERHGNVSKVIFNDNAPDFILDEILLEFDTAVESGDLRKAMAFLESFKLNPETESTWRVLARVALKSGDVWVAERSYAAVGDITRANYVRECFDNPDKLALLENDWSAFETNHFDEAIQTYILLHKWNKAIDLALRFGQIDVQKDLEKKYYEYLIKTDQQAEAGHLMERSGRFEEAIKLYMKSGQIIQTSNLILSLANRKNFAISKNLIEELIGDLESAHFYEEAGQLNELPIIENFPKAFDLYIKGKCFNRAIDLARKEFPEEVVKLENQYGEYLLKEGRDPSSAINHFIEAGKTDRALEAAVQGKQFEKAAEIASVLNKLSPHLGKPIAEYFASKGRIDSAVEIYLICDCVRDAILLLNQHNQFNRAYKLAQNVMVEDEAKEMYSNIAKLLENEGKLKEAEKIYVTCNHVDLAITMYKNRKQYDSMIRLVKQYHPDLLSDTHLHLAKELEAEGSLTQAESHYIANNDWKAAVCMYKNANKWEEAYRVARAYGGAVPAKQVAYFWAKSLPEIEDSVKLLNRFGLLNQVIDYAVENNAFDFANKLVINTGPEMKHKVNEVKLKYALWLKTENRFEEAEIIFIEVNKAKEAVFMYLQNQNFEKAIKVAELHVKDESVISDVLVAQAKSIVENNGQSISNLNKAESLLLRAGRIELAVKMYKDLGIWDEAIRVCEQYSPALIDSVKRDMILSNQNDLTSVSKASAQPKGLLKFRKDSLNTIQDLRAEIEAAEIAGNREAVVKNALLLASQFVNKKSCEDALKIMIKYSSCLMLSEARVLLSKIASDLFAFEKCFEPDISVWKHLRDCLLQLITSDSNQHKNSPTFEKYLLLSHYFILKNILTNLINHSGAKDLLMKLCIALLRYTDIIRVDKAFYEAGKIAKENLKLNIAFVFWNHFLDLVDAIEEGELNIDHSDFEETDIPFKVSLPSQPFSIETEPDLIENVKSWILQITMDFNVSHSLPLDPDRDDVYEASLLNRDGTTCLPCLVTGYPVVKTKMLELSPEKYAANRDDWNKLLVLVKTLASEELKDVILFVGKLCGNATVARFSFR